MPFLIPILLVGGTWAVVQADDALDQTQNTLSSVILLALLGGGAYLAYKAGVFK